MTLIDIKNLIFSHFLTASTFSLNEDVPSITLHNKSLDENILLNKVEIFKIALDDFVKAGVLVEISPGLYLLTQPLDAFSQTLTLSPMVAEMVADILEEAGFTQDGRPYQVNRLAITSDDIGILCSICHMLMEEGDEPEESDHD